MAQTPTGQRRHRSRIGTMTPPLTPPSRGTNRSPRAFTRLNAVDFQPRIPPPCRRMLAEEKEPMLEGSDVALAQEFQQKYQALLAEVHRVIIGQDKIIEQLLTVLFARRHAL